MEIKDIASSLSVLLAAASIMVAVYTFNRNYDRTSFSKFRLSLIDLRHLVKKLDAQLTEPVFNEVGIAIAAELEQTFGTDISIEDLIIALKDEDKQNYVRQAIHVGIRKAPASSGLEEIIDSLERTPVEFYEEFAIISAIIAQLNFYLVRPARGLISPRVFNGFLCDNDMIDGALAKELRKQTSTHLAYREIGLMLSTLPHQILDGNIQKSIDDTRRLVDILVNRFLRYSDAELRAQSRRQRALASRLSSVSKATPIEEVYEYFKFIQSEFSDVWDTIVEAKTRIYEHTKGKEA